MPYNKTLEKGLKEGIHKIFQEELADRVIYQDRFAEETLRRGLQSAETRLNIFLTTFAEKIRESMVEEVEKMVEQLDVSGRDDYTKTKDSTSKYGIPVPFINKNDLLAQLKDK